MHSLFRVLLFSSACAALTAGGVNREAARALANLPVRFEPVGSNQQQFVARGVRFHTQISATGNRVLAGGKAVTLRFEGARQVPLEGVDRMAGITNILRGNDHSRWQFGIPNFARVKAAGIYPGIDIVYYGSHGELEYDLVLHPGADPRRIRLKVTGAQALLDDEGNLVAGAIHKRPVTYQTAADGSRRPVASRFRRNSDGTFGFEVARYDRRSDLVIDPQVSVSAYVAGESQDIAVGVGHDANGFLYVGGTTYSSDLPVSDNALQTAIGGNSDLFLVKIDPRLPAGSQIVYSTFAGGTAAEVMTGMVVDPQGGVYMTGSTASNDFPLGNAAQAAISGTTDAFVLWLEVSQSGPSAMFYGTYLGGNADDMGTGIALDPQGRIAIIGSTKSTDLAAGNGYSTALLGTEDAFVALLDPRQSGTATLVYLTYLGGTNWDTGSGIAAAPDGTLWATGYTMSGDYPIAGNAIQPNYGYAGDAFVSQIDPNQAGGSSLLYSSYLGGSDNDQGNAISVDSTGRILVTGYTLSADFPVTGTAVQRQLATAGADFPNANAFVFAMKRSDAVYAGSQMLYSSYLGGSGGDEGYAIASDSSGDIYVAGLTKSLDFPVTRDAMQSSILGGPAGFVVRLNTSRTTPDYASLVTSTGNQVIYGLDVDARGTVYMAGSTSGPLLEALGGVARTTSPGSSDAFLAGFASCATSASPATLTFPAGGGIQTVTVSAGAGCGWTAASGSDWLTVAPKQGDGGGTVTVAAGPNLTGADRTGSIAVATTTITVTQPAQ